MLGLARSERPELLTLGIDVIEVDFSRPENLEAAFAAHGDRMLRSDAVVNAAALLESIPFMNLTPQDILRALTVNLLPGIVLMQRLVPSMRSRSFGRFVHLSSIGVKFRGGSGSFSYALSKHALEFLPSDYKAWAKDNVFVNALRVGVTDTRIHGRDPSKDMGKRIAQIPAGRMATAQEMAQLIYYYGSGENSFTTGEVIAAAGGE